MKDLADADFVVEAVVESLEVKKSIFRDLEAIVKPEAILATNTSSLSVTEISTANAHPGRVIGVHFFNPAPVQNFVEIIRTVVTEPDVLDDVTALVGRLGKNPVVCGDRAGFIANTLLFGYLNHAASMYEAPLRLARGHRRRDALRLRLPDGPAGAARPDRPRHGVRDPRHDVQAGPRPAARAHADPQAAGHRRLARPQDRPRLLHLRGTPTARSSSPTPTRRAPTTSRSWSAPISRIGVVGTGTMATGIVEVFAKAGYDVTYVGRAQAKVDGVRATIERSLDKAIQRGKLEESVKPEVLGRLTGTTRLDDLADADLVVEAIAEDLAVKTTLFENLDEICKPGAILATTTSSLPIISCATATKRPQDVIGMHFFNPAPIMKLVEVVSTVTTADDVTRDRAARCASRSARSPSRAATGPASSSTRCCSPTSTTR